MDRDEILRQGKDIAATLRGEVSEQAAHHEQQIKDALEKVADFVNDKTGGRYADHVDKAAGFVEQGVTKLADASWGEASPDERPPSP